MRTHQELADAAAKTIFTIDTVARITGVSQTDRLKLITDTVVDVLALAQTELLASQRDTAVALANALNVAGGK